MPDLRSPPLQHEEDLELLPQEPMQLEQAPQEPVAQQQVLAALPRLPRPPRQRQDRAYRHRRPPPHLRKDRSPVPVESRH